MQQIVRQTQVHSLSVIKIFKNTVSLHVYVDILKPKKSANLFINDCLYIKTMLVFLVFYFFLTVISFLITRLYGHT